MRNFRRFFCSTIFAVFIGPPIGQAAPFEDVNILPVTFVALQPVITITACVPNTDDCTTISNVLLDSGSDGLRLFSSTLPNGLPQIKDASGHVVANCGTLGGGKSAWGPMKLADIILGANRAQGVPIQAIDSTFLGIPDGCANAMDLPSTMSGLNGIIGIGTGLRPPISEMPHGNGFFSCLGSSCRSCESYMSWDSCGAGFPAMPRDLNPITFMATDNNGWILRLPTPDPKGSATLSGTLTLGLGTRANNSTPQNLRVFAIDSRGLTASEFGGAIYDALLDTGSAVWVLPTDLQNVPRCAAPISNFYCPINPIHLGVALFNETTSPKERVEVGFDIMSLTDLKEVGAANNVGMTLKSDSIARSIFLLGAPFFMGRTVYYGILGAKTPLGMGPFNAF